MHASAAAALAWRTAQLLSTLPRRGTEAAAWAHAGEALFGAAPGGFPGGVVAAFGGLQVRRDRVCSAWVRGCARPLP